MYLKSAVLIFGALISFYSCGKKEVSTEPAYTSNAIESTTNSKAVESNATDPTNVTSKGNNTALAKYEPKGGKRLLFIGQNLDDIGGTDGHNNGYMNHFDPPAGISLNIKIKTGDTENGHLHGPLSGLFSTDDWGDGPTNMSTYMAEYDLVNSAVSLGVDFSGHGSKIAAGYYDDHLTQLATWIKAMGDRPIFLRLGYNFDNEQNPYESEYYWTYFRYVKELFDNEGVTNVAYVWQTDGFSSTPGELENWYPGDDYVDWVAYTYFQHRDYSSTLNFAKTHRKPVLIAASTPVLGSGDRLTQLNFTKADEALSARRNWFDQFFAHINSNATVIKGITYVSSNWQKYKYYLNNPMLSKADSRLFVNPVIKSMWQEEIDKEVYLKPTDDMWQQLSTR